MDIVLKLDPDGADVEPILNGLIAYNKAIGGPTGFQPFAVLLREPATGAVVGGLSGRAIYDWLYVELFHVPEALRGQGHGTRLMQAAEDFARQRGLDGIWLDTYSFQARPFYEKLGFTVFGTIDGHPRNGQRFFLQKRLRP